MIETDATGQKMMYQLCAAVDDEFWNEWEQTFITNLEVKKYSSLSTKQKSIITDLTEKLSEMGNKRKKEQREY